MTKAERKFIKVNSRACNQLENILDIRNKDI